MILPTLGMGGGTKLTPVGAASDAIFPEPIGAKASPTDPSLIGAALTAIFRAPIGAKAPPTASTIFSNPNPGFSS